MRREIRPSCGIRFSAISSLAITLIRETNKEASFRLGFNISRKIPSTRKRICKLFSKVSIWISEALSLMASLSMALISLIIGASSSFSSKSSLSVNSSANEYKSTSLPISSIICCASEESLWYAWVSSNSNSGNCKKSKLKGAFRMRRISKIMSKLTSAKQCKI